MNSSSSMLTLAGYSLLIIVAATTGPVKPAMGQGKASAPVVKQPAAPTGVARGEVELGFVKPVPKRTGSEMVTTIKVKNLSSLQIIGLMVEDYWYDKAGNPVTGDQYRH